MVGDDDDRAAGRDLFAILVADLVADLHHLEDRGEVAGTRLIEVQGAQVKVVHRIERKQLLDGLFDQLPKAVHDGPHSTVRNFTGACACETKKARSSFVHVAGTSLSPART